MSDFLATLNTNSGALTVVFSAVVTLATVVYALLTWKLVAETRLMREVQTEPKIEVVPTSPEIAFHLLRLHIRNVGLGPALDLKFAFQVLSGNDAAKNLIEDFSKTNFLKTGLAYFGAGQERFSHFTEMNRDHDEKIAAVIAVDLSYRSVTGKKYKEIFVIDLSEYKGAYQLGRPYLYWIAKSLDKLQESVDLISSGYRRLKMDVFTAEDRISERARLDEWREAQDASGAEVSNKLEGDT
jgi:hypothetical protein